MDFILVAEQQWGASQSPRIACALAAALVCFSQRRGLLRVDGI